MTKPKILKKLNISGMDQIDIQKKIKMNDEDEKVI